jgi:hypothetical protein
MPNGLAVRHFTDNLQIATVRSLERRNGCHLAQPKMNLADFNRMAGLGLHTALHLPWQSAQQIELKAWTAPSRSCAGMQRPSVPCRLAERPLHVIGRRRNRLIGTSREELFAVCG